MHCLVALVALVGFAEARPRSLDIIPSNSFDPHIIGGVEATPREFPWQLSQERLSGTWFHSCSASLLASNAALTAGHCVDGAAVVNIRVIAGVHNRSDQSEAQISGLTSYTLHENFGLGIWTYPHDIAIMTLAQPIQLANNVALLTLPPDNSEEFVGITCTLIGWGRTSASEIYSDVLYKADSTVISTDECNTRMAAASGAICDYSQIAVYDASASKGICNGDVGGPLNCPLEGTVVAGVASWWIKQGETCLPSYPSVYTRTSFYLGWIAANTP